MRGRLAVSAFAVALCIAGCGRKPVEEPVAEEAVVYPLGFDTSAFRADTSLVRSGDTFSGMLSRLGMNRDSAYVMSQLCDSVFDVRKLRAGNEVHAYYGADSTLQYMVYIQNKVRSTVFKCSDSLAVWNSDKPTEQQRKLGDVVIESSLWDAMTAAHATPELIMDLSDIYQWSVNFFGLQPGDRFRIIYDQTVCEDEVVSIDTVFFCLFNSADGKEVGALRYEIPGKGADYWGKDGESLKRMFLKAPLKYNRISSRFTYHRKHPVYGVVKPHTAVDYAAPTGTPVHAIGDGTVTRCSWDGSGGGNYVKIKHPQGYESGYMHLSRYAPGLKVGSYVRQGDLIGYVGQTGTATGPHLDFRIWQNGKPVDPLSINSPASDPLDTAYLKDFTAIYDRYISELNGD